LREDIANHHIFQQASQQLVDLREALGTLQPPASFKTIPILYLETDGPAKTREAKLGCVFTQTTTDEDGNPMLDPESISYVGTMGDRRESGELLRAEAIRRCLALAQIIIFLGDGAAWIWENARLYFPTAIQILDFYHAVEHLGVLVRGCIIKSPHFQAAWQARRPIIAARQAKARRWKDAS
jgi:hypothetical protein